MNVIRIVALNGHTNRFDSDGFGWSQSAHFVHVYSKDGRVNHTFPWTTIQQFTEISE